MAIANAISEMEDSYSDDEIDDEEDQIHDLVVLDIQNREVIDTIDPSLINLYKTHNWVL